MGIAELVAKEARSDAISMSERWGQLIPLAGTALVILFFVIHQTRPTGFFTAEFGTLATVLTWGMVAVGTIPFFVRMIKGSKNYTRPFEIGSMAVSFVALLYLLIVFPFNFAHFAAPLPASLEFLLDWVPSVLGWWVLAIGVVGSALFAVYTLFLYLAVRKSMAAGNEPVDQKKDDQTTCVDIIRSSLD